jgi:hypothetical protein
MAISATAVTFIVLAVYLLISDWGTVDQGFFLGWCISIILFGVIINQIIYTGTLGINHQKHTIGGVTSLALPSLSHRMLEWESHLTHLPSWYSLLLYCCFVCRHSDDEDKQIFTANSR